MDSGKHFDYIPARMNLIHKILDGNNLNPLLELESNETDAFVNNTNDNDIRNVLNKKVLEFGQVINAIGSKLVYIKSGTTGHTFRGFDPGNPNNQSNTDQRYRFQAFETRTLHLQFLPLG